MAFIHYKDIKIFISKSPSENDMNKTIDFLNNNNIKSVVRLCEPIYDMFKLKDINFYELPFEDGSIPSDEIIKQWVDIINNTNDNILVHCMAGQGRAPMMAAIAMLDMGVNRYEAIKTIRDIIPTCINTRQLQFIIRYKSKKPSTFKSFFCGLL